MLSSIAAEEIDRTRFTCDNDKNFFSHGLNEVKVRLISFIVFPIFCSLDAIYFSLIFWKERLQGRIATGAVKEEHFKKAAIALDLFKKCLYGGLGSLFSAIHADVASIHFIRPLHEEGIARPYGGLYFQKVEEIKPATAEEVQEIIKKAKAEKREVGIAGARFSQGKQILPQKEGQILLDMKNFNKIRIDGERKVATVGGGAIWKELQDEANQMNLAVQVQQASDVFSIGGSISVNCHGWDHIQGSLGHTLLSITLVDADGNIQKLLPEDDLFKCVVGGFGQFGVILEADIQLVDNQNLVEKGIPVEPRNFYHYFKQEVMNDPKIKMTLYRLSLDPKNLLKKGVAQHYYEAARPLPEPKELKDEPDGGRRFDRIALQIGRRFAVFRRFWDRLNWKAMQKENFMTRNEAMRPPIKAAITHSKTYCEWLQEFFVKGEDLADFLEELGKTLMENRVPLLNCSVRYVKQDETSHLPYAKDGDRFAVVLFYNQSLAPRKVEQTKNWVKKMIDYVGARGGSYYLPYQHFATKEQFRLCYPHFETIAKKKKIYDPQGVFKSGLAADYFEE